MESTVVSDTPSISIAHNGPTIKKNGPAAKQGDAKPAEPTASERKVALKKTSTDSDGETTSASCSSMVTESDGDSVFMSEHDDTDIEDESYCEGYRIIDLSPLEVVQG